MSDLKTIRGMPDLYNESIEAISLVEKICTKVFKSFNYQEFRTPIIESKSLFQRSVGESSDIIQKEVYEFEDRNGELLCLRPEGTAGLVRALITNGITNDEIKKFYYLGPMFRYERPQKGRKRQFFQAGVELIGDNSPKSDVEIISIASAILDELDVKTKLEINYLGNSASLGKYRDYLRDFIAERENQFEASLFERLNKNPMRALDSKDDSVKKTISSAKNISEFLNNEEVKIFEETLSLLNEIGINYEVNKNLVRGMDYYTGTVFEFTVESLGAQNAVIGGGRYDDLIKELGGRQLAATGFALGIDRLAEVITKRSKPKDLFIGFAEDKAIGYAQKIGNKIRKLNRELVVENYLGNANVTKQLKKANSQGFKFVMIIGQEEQKTGNYRIKNLSEGKEFILDEKGLEELLIG